MERKTQVILLRWMRPHHYVVLFFIITLLGIFSSYGIAVSQHAVNPLFPFISDTGAKPPASCVFGMMSNLSGFIGFIIVYLWHLLFEQYSHLDQSALHIWNDIAWLMGAASTFGLLLVANFQDINVLSMHMLGALMTFVCGIIYCWIITYLSKVSIVTGLSTSRKFVCRLVLSICATISFVATFTGGTVSMKQFTTNSTRPSDEKRFHWSENDGGYDWHLVSTFGEWLMVISFAMFFVTFYADFRQVSSSVRVVHSLGTSDGIECFRGDTEDDGGQFPDTNSIASSATPDVYA